MRRFKNYLVLTMALTAAVALGGCGKQGGSQSYPAAGPATAEESEASDSSTHAGATEIEKALAALSEADRTASEKQGTCLVTGKQLGSMGTPPKITLKGQEVFMCCAGCEEELSSNPDTYLAKLKQ